MPEEEAIGDQPYPQQRREREDPAHPAARGVAEHGGHHQADGDDRLQLVLDHHLTLGTPLPPMWANGRKRQQRHEPGKPRPLLDRPQPARVVVPVAPPYREDGQRHAGGEGLHPRRQHHEPRERVLVPRLKDGREDDDLPHDPEGREGNQRPQFGQPAPHRPGPDRQEGVEGHLDAERPRLPDAPVDRGDVVDLQEAVVGDDAVDAEHLALEPQPHGDHGQRDPIGRDDAQGAADRVAAQARRRPALRAPRHERAVEQEARDHEEDRHADVQLAEPGEVGIVERKLGRRDVEAEDRQGGDRSQRVEEGEPRPIAHRTRHTVAQP